MFALSAVHGQSMADSATQWQVFQHEEYRPFDAAKDAGVKSIYIVMNLDAYSNDYLYIESRLHPSIFVNGKLFVALSGEAMKIALDSIKTFAHTSQVQIGIFQSTINPGTLHAELVSATKNAELNNVVSRPPSYFRDFVILASMFLLILLVVIIYASPKLASDYLSITKLFTAHDSDDMQSGVRSVNISSVLFYLLLALMFSLFFKIVFHFAEPRITVAWYFNGVSVAGEVLSLIHI